MQYLLTSFSASEKDGYICYKTVPTIQSGVAPALFSQLSRAHMRCKRARESGSGKHLGSRTSAVALAIQSLVFSRVLTPAMSICPPLPPSDYDFTIITPTHFPALMNDSLDCVLVRVSIIKSKTTTRNTSSPSPNRGDRPASSSSLGLKPSQQPKPMRQRRGSMFMDIDGFVEAEAELESGSIHAALAVAGRPPIRMLISQLLVYVGGDGAVIFCNNYGRYRGSMTARLDGSNKKFVGCVTLVGSTSDGPVPPIRIM